MNEEIDCPYCNGREAIRGKTSLKAFHSEMMTEWNLGNWLFIDPDIIENYSGSSANEENGKENSKQKESRSDKQQYLNFMRTPKLQGKLDLTYNGRNKTENFPTKLRKSWNPYKDWAGRVLSQIFEKQQIKVI